MESGILSTIGRTPLAHLKKIYPELPLQFYAKLEMFNPGGSIKDRPALNILSSLLENGQINRDTTIIESSSGNMAIGLAQVCRYLGLKLIVVVDPKINRHTLSILQTYGVNIEKVTEANAEGNYLAARLQRVRELCEELPNTYWPNQYKNKLNTGAHYQTMQEIVEALREPPDYLLTATSTCGTIMGCARYVQENGLDTKIVAVDAVGSVIFGTEAGNRLVPGHGAGKHADLLDETLIDHVFHISDNECITGCHRLLDKEAILAGGSSGAVVMAAEKLATRIPDGSTCVLILPDSGERYLDTVYNEDWVKEHFGHRKKENVSVTSYSFNGVKEIDKKRAEGPLKIAIVGGGPKGMYGFERLAAQFKAHPSQAHVEIHVYNKSEHFGAGDIYNPHQPAYLLLNNPAGDITMWIDEPPDQVVDNAMPLVEWLQINSDKNASKNDYVSRKVVGKYLMQGFKDIAIHLSQNVRGKYLIGQVRDIFKNGNKYQVEVKTADGSAQKIPHCYDHILLATGHPRNQLDEQEKEFQEFADRKKKVAFIPFIYPVEKTLASIPAGSGVGIKGIGLTFIDAMLALTEGRGGTFNRNPTNGRLVYQPSGKEPKKIYPFSRSGLPMLPRGPELENQIPLKFFTSSTLDELKKNHPQNKLHFKEEILPLLRNEFLFAFYNVEMSQTGFKDDLSDCATIAELKYYISQYLDQHDVRRPFDPETFLAPLQGKQFSDGTAFHDYIYNYLSFFLEEARKGEAHSPWAAVAAVWRKITPFFGNYYAHGALAPRSQRYFDGSFRRLLDRVTFGPPIESVDKLVALMEAGFVRFDMAQHPDLTIDHENGRFVLESPKVKQQQPINCIVDARISKVSLLQDRDPLYRNLLRRGLITIYKNEYGEESYQPGCIAISPEGYVIDGQGHINQAIAVTGTPTEGVTFDNDTLARSRNNIVSAWAADVQALHTKSVITTLENE